MENTFIIKNTEYEVNCFFKDKGENLDNKLLKFMEKELQNYSKNRNGK